MDSIYREELLDHYKYPRNQGKLDSPDVEVNETNASCGDSLKLQLKIENNAVEEAKYQCQGCVISTAVSSMLSEKIKGMSLEEIKKLTLDDVYKLLGGPVTVGRVKCAGLMLKTLEKAIKDYGKNSE